MPEDAAEAHWHALAGLLAFQGKDLIPTQTDEERAVYQVVGAGLWFEHMQAAKALVGLMPVKK